MQFMTIPRRSICALLFNLLIFTKIKNLSQKRTLLHYERRSLQPLGDEMAADEVHLLPRVGVAGHAEVSQVQLQLPPIAHLK
jgi:hypothetical protein